MSKDEIENNISAKGFRPFIYGLEINELYEPGDDMVAAIATVISAREMLLEERDREFLETLGPSEFFSGQRFLSKLILHLYMPAHQAMELTAALVATLALFAREAGASRDRIIILVLDGAG